MENHTSSTGRRSASDGHTYGPEELAEMASKLRALPAVDPSKRRTNKQGAIRYLADEIGALQARGYTMEQITERLKDLGIDMSTPTLKSYLQRAKEGGAKPSKRGRRRRRRAAMHQSAAAQTATNGDRPGAASSRMPVSPTSLGTVNSSPRVAEQSNTPRPETASTLARPPATAETMTRAAAPPLGARPLPPPGPRIDSPKIDVPPVRASASVGAHDRKDASASSEKSRP